MFNGGQFTLKVSCFAQPWLRPGCRHGGMDALFLSMILSGLVVAATGLMMLLPN
jgi:hypothetical protein